MATVSEVSTAPLSGLTHVDALLNTSPGWNWLLPTRSQLYYTFSVSSGNETGNSGISTVTAFNAAQQAACLAQLAYISQLTGITFTAATSPTTADLHFAATDLLASPSTSGLCSSSSGYSYNPSTNVVVSYSATAYVYLDNVEWATQNGAPVAGNAGYETLLHELGHALGLKHPFSGTPVLPTAEDNSSNTVMSYTDSGGPYSTFRPYDVAALMWLYGGDGLGGSLGVSTSAVYLVGTTVANSLTGGSGNDMLQGLAGNDTLTGGLGDDTAIYSGNRADYTITTTTGGYSISSTAEGQDTLTGIEYAKFSDQTLTLSTIAPVDVTAPTITTFSPVDGATGVAVASNIVLTFNEAIQRGTGSILLKNAAGTTIETYDAATSSLVSISGTVLTINPTSDLANSTNYYVVFASGNIKDLAGNAYAGTSTYDFTTAAATTTTSTTTKAKVFMGTNDKFTVNDSGATLVGNLGSNTVKIAAGVTGIKTDANFARIELSGNLGDYKFGVIAGTGLQIQTSAGVAIDTIVSLNTDTTVAFANGSAVLAQTGITAFSLGGLTISTTTPATVSATLNASDKSSFGTATARDTTKAKVYMGVDDSFTVSDSGATLIGNLGSNTVKIASGVTGLTTDANFSRIELGGNLADYKLGVIVGTGLQIQTSAGIAVDTIVSLNSDVTLAFANGSAKLSQTGITAFTLGGQTVSTTAPAVMSVTLNATDKSSLSMVGSMIDVSATDNTAEFAASDKLVFDSGANISTTTVSSADGNLVITDLTSGESVTINLAGIALAADAFNFNLFSV